MRKILENKGLQANNGIKFEPLKRSDFADGGFTEYTYSIAVLSDRLYAYQTKQADFSAVRLQLKTVNQYLQLGTDELKTVADYISRGGLVTAVKPYRHLTDESTTTRAVLKAEVEAAEASGNTLAIENAKRALRDFMRTEARYEVEVAEQSRYNGFRKSFEQLIARLLAQNLQVKQALQANKQARYSDMWAKWTGKAAVLDIAYQDYIEADDIEGLKKAVRAAFETSKEVQGDK